MSKSITFAAIAAEYGEGQFLQLVSNIETEEDLDAVEAAVTYVPVTIGGQQFPGELDLTGTMARAIDDASNGAFYGLLHPETGDDSLVVWLHEQPAALAALAAAAKAFVPAKSGPTSPAQHRIKQFLVDFAAAAQALLEQHGSRAVLLVA